MTLKLQIIWPDGRVAQLPAGGPLEKELIEDVMNRVRTKKLGRLKSQSQVEAAVEDAINEAFVELKNRTRQGFK